MYELVGRLLYQKNQRYPEPDLCSQAANQQVVRPHATLVGQPSINVKKVALSIHSHL